MPPLLSRLSLCLAALAAAASLFVSGQRATALVAVAIACLAASWWLQRFRAAAPAETVPDAAQLDAITLLEVAERIDRGTADAESLEDAMHRAGDVLVHELGMTGVAVREILRSHDDSIPVLARRASDEAVRTGRAAGGPQIGYALPVRQGGQIVALIEIASCEMPVLPAALLHLLELVRARLDALGDALLAAQAPADPSPADALLAGTADDSPLGHADGFLSMLAENLPVSLFVLAPGDRCVLAINRHAETEFGLRRSALLGRRLDETFDAALVAQVVPFMERAERERTVVDAECDWQAHGGRRVIHVRHFVLRRSDGTPHLLIALARDITADRADALRLQESEARFREFAASSEDTLFISNPERSRFEFIGGGLARTTHGSVSDPYSAMTRRYIDLVVEEDRHLLHERTDRERRLEPADISYRIEHPQIGTRWMRCRTRTAAQPDGTLRVYGVLSDVTHEREHEEALQRALADAKAASRAKSQFMANMSHEIRTPMNGILGMTELLLGTQLDARQRGFARAVYNAGESLLDVIGDILDFSKIEAGRLELANADFTLRSVVEDTLELLAPRAHEKGLELGFLESPDLPAAVHGDSLRLRQVLTHLVANAIKFTDRGEVVVTLCPAPDAAPGTVQFSVRDTGMGIAPEYMPRLFEAFTQAQADNTRRHGGTGLGLAIARQLSELMGGRIEAKSQLGIGSEFIVRVPLAPARSGGAGREPEPAELGGRRVLVVDDHETNRTVLENTLAAWGMAVVLAEDGLQALDILRADAAGFDFALVDMRMPRLDGLGLARALAQQKLAPKMRLLLLSSASTADDVRDAQQAGFDRFIAKPVRRAELRQALLGVMAGGADETSPRVALQGSVLVVEDNPVNQEVIGQMLRQLGLTVRVAGGAMQGLRALCEAHFDLVLMDIQMPGMDGVEALTWFRRGSGGRFDFLTPPATKVVAVTANALGGDEERYLSLGFDDYLSKPFRQSQLLAMLSKRLAPSPDVPGAPASGDAGAAEPTTSVLDAGALDRLRELDPRGDNQLIARVVSAFETSVGRLLPQLQDARRGGDMAGIRHVAHTLKSSSASVGALKLSHLCAETETMIRLERVESLDSAVDGICRESEIVLQALKQLLNNTP